MTQIYEYADAWSFRHGSPQKESFAPLIEIEVDEGVIACLTRSGSHPLDPQQPPGDNIVTAEVYFLKRTFKDLATAACWHNNILGMTDKRQGTGHVNPSTPGYSLPPRTRLVSGESPWQEIFGR